MAVGGCAGIAAVVAACGGSESNSPSASSGGGGSIPSGLSVNSFDVNFSVMSQFKGLVSAGKGLVGVVLPDTTSSTRYVNFDQPYLTTAFQNAGYSQSQFKIDNAQGSDATELADVQSDITLGASVIVFDPLDSTVGTQIQQYASQHGVSVISYDRATFSGTNTYYVSFDNVQVGKLIGQGFEDCVSSWNVSSPKVFTLNGGEDTDPNAISFAQGYNQVVWGSTDTPQKAGTTNSKGYTLVGDQITPGWVNATGGTIFQQQYTAHPNINATIEANDGLANAVITVLKNTGAKAKTIPTTGQDATPQGMENVLAGYQCGSVYKAVYKEAGAAVALATILRAGKTPPSSLVNGTTSPPSGVTGNQQPAILLTPVWVTTSNMESTVIKDKFVDAATICGVVGASVCSQYGIS
ncbi:MAG: substrate-binding domain-containing protein [Candidatus Dormibacteraeota bacterium]|nr:substrate-binding domain-containing protein [Candidatus Dormibacteraeota bacterium]